MSVHVEVDRCTDHTVIRAIGELDAATSETLGASVFSALAQGPTPVLLDVSEVTFIDSTGLSLLVRAHREAVARDAVFAVVHPTPQTHKLVRLLGLDQLLSIHDTPEQALGAAI